MPKKLYNKTNGQMGLTLVELVVTAGILAILATAAVPIARFAIRREQERELKYDLAQIRSAIDEYKRAADAGAFQIKIDSFGYPPDLDTLAAGVEIQTKKVKFLKRIPVDPITHQADWVMRSMQDEPTTDSWGGQNVFDVHSKSDGVGLNGIHYREW
ncbi:type II secretion system protein [Terracidiphilus sp.]|jgi:general secretion pathway protein G|uniref:type II secretion system protein n=1 Tax=Terracidiphilus sp. TaxID=1964191 RepID=UPI003C1C1A67